MLWFFPPCPPAIGRLRRKRRISFSFNLSPILTKSKSQFIYGDSSSSDDEDNLSKYCSVNIVAVENRCDVGVKRVAVVVRALDLVTVTHSQCECENNDGLSC